MIDLTYPIRGGMPVFPGDPPVEMARACSIATQDSPFNVTRLTLGVHSGTHMDAPRHFFDGRDAIDGADLAHCIGPALLIDLAPSAAGRRISEQDLAAWGDRLAQVRKVVLRTGWARYWGQPEYFDAHPSISEAAARFLVARRVHLVGIDAPSVDRQPYPAHRILLGAGALIVENLANLDRIVRQVFQLVVLPLKLEGADGSPVRAIALEADA